VSPPSCLFSPTLPLSKNRLFPLQNSSSLFPYPAAYTPMSTLHYISHFQKKKFIENADYITDQNVVIEKEKKRLSSCLSSPTLPLSKNRLFPLQNSSSLFPYPFFTLSKLFLFLGIPSWSKCHKTVIYKVSKIVPMSIVIYKYEVVII
jgi:hypothetical protein